MTATQARSNVAIAGVAGLAVFGGLWELLVRWRNINPSILRAPSQIVAAFFADPAPYALATWNTLWHTVCGLAFALIGALAVGGMLARSRVAEHAAQPVLILVLVTPWVAYFTSLVTWLGAGDPPVVFLVSLVTFPGFVFAMVTGLRSADADALELFASVHASRWETLWRLRLPTALPTVLAAARFNTGLALAAAYFGEGGNLTNGGALGSIGRKAASQPAGGDALWVTIVVTAILGAVLLGSITVFERVALRWHESQR